MCDTDDIKMQETVSPDMFSTHTHVLSAFFYLYHLSNACHDSFEQKGVQYLHDQLDRVLFEMSVSYSLQGQKTKKLLEVTRILLEYGV